MTEDQHREICILASMSKDGAAEMDSAEDAQHYFAKSLGVGAMQHWISAEKYNKRMMTNGDMQLHQGTGG